MADWQTIDSAPKDGTHVLAWQYERGGAFVAYFWGSRNQWIAIPGGITRKPTHWQPLPPPPGANPDG